MYIYFGSRRCRREKQQLPSNSWYGKMTAVFLDRTKTHTYCVKTIDFKKI